MTVELAGLDHLEKSPYTYNGDNVVNALTPSLLIGSPSFLQVIRTTIRVRVSSKFGQIQPWTADVAALECLERTTIKSRMSSKFDQILPWTAD